jgi:hypothetical protein
MSLSEYQIPGVVSDGYVEYQHLQRLNELNDRIHERDDAVAQPFHPVMDIFSVSTRYAFFPILDRRPPSQPAPTTLASNYEVDNELHFSKSKYIPSSTSDMYSDRFRVLPPSYAPVSLPARTVPSQIGNDTFLNATRTQLRMSARK